VAPSGEEYPIPAKAVGYRLYAGDAFVVETSGGGGLGKEG
jgi:hypothetical protein